MENRYNNCGEFYLKSLCIMYLQTSLKRLQISLNPVTHAINGVLGGRITIKKRTMLVESAAEQKCVGKFPDSD